MRQSSPGRLSHGRRRQWDTTGILLDETITRAPLALDTIFGNGRPVEVEIGPGKGAFLLARAAARPELNFLGLEYAKSYCSYAADRCRRAGLQNVRLLRCEALHFFSTCLPDACLWRVHIYFPDPWPKRRHHSRRLFQPTFVRQLRRTLRPGGQLLVVSDHLAYFQQIAALLDAAGNFAIVDFPVMGDKDGELVGTNFERKYIAQGKLFYRLARLRYR